MNRAQLKKEAKGILKGQWLYVVIAMFFANMFYRYIPFMIIVNEITEIFLQGGKTPGFPLILSFILIFVVGPYIKAGLAQFCIKTARGESPQMVEIFEQNHLLVKSVCMNLLIILFLFLWSLLLVIPGIVAAYRYRFAYYILAENPEMSAIEAMCESKRISKGKKFNMFTLDLSFLGWRILATALFLIPNLWVDPYTEITYSVLYNKLKKGN